jgi:hypothetical protein
MIEAWIQYTHLDKLYGYLPGMAQSVPAVFGDLSAYTSAMVLRRWPTTLADRPDWIIRSA